MSKQKDFDWNLRDEATGEFLKRLVDFLDDGTPTEASKLLVPLGVATKREEAIFAFFRHIRPSLGLNEGDPTFEHLSDLWEEEIRRSSKKISTDDRLALQEIAKYFWLRFWQFGQSDG